MADYDNENKGVVFRGAGDRKIVAAGKLNINGNEGPVIMVRQALSREGTQYMVLYQKIATFFENTSDNEKAPNYSGKVDHTELRIAGWKGKKEDREYISLRISEPFDGEGKSAETPAAKGGKKHHEVPDDEIPF
jgi:uncharacterized protein (DUF736 family)